MQSKSCENLALLLTHHTHYINKFYQLYLETIPRMRPFCLLYHHCEPSPSPSHYHFSSGLVYWLPITSISASALTSCCPFSTDKVNMLKPQSNHVTPFLKIFQLSLYSSPFSQFQLLGFLTVIQKLQGYSIPSSYTGCFLCVIILPPELYMLLALCLLGLSSAILSNPFCNHLNGICNLSNWDCLSPLCHLTYYNVLYFFILIMGHLPQVRAPCGQDFYQSALTLDSRKVHSSWQALNKYFLSKEMNPRFPFCT